MANKLTTAQQNLVIESLSLDKASNYSRLEYYLKQIIAGRDVVFETRSDQPFVVSPQEAWSIIVSWSQSEGNLPVGDRNSKFNARSRATHLLDYLQTNVSGKTAEAAASYQLILDQAKNKIVTPLPSQTVNDYNLQKIYDLRHLQIQIQQAGLIGKIYSNLEKTKILEGVPKESRTRVLQMLATANQNFRYSPKNSYEDFTPEKIHQLLLHAPGVQDANQIMRMFYSKAAQKDIATIYETISQSIQEEYHGDESKYLAYMDSVKDTSALAPSLSSISYLVNNIDIHASPEEKIALIRSLRSQIVGSAMGQHQGGDALLRSALVSAGFPEASADYYKSLLPYLEEIEIKQRHLLLGSDPADRDPRLLSTAGLATELGVDLTTPWTNKSDLDSVTAKILKDSGASSLQEAFDAEYSGGKNLAKLAQINDLISKHAEHKIYADSLAGNFWYKVRDTFDKGTGNYLSVRQPIDRLTRKVWGGIENIDNVIHWPQHKLAEWIEKTQEKLPWLDPGKLIATKWVSYQTGIALRIHAWAISASTSSWFSGFAGHVADFTEGFVKHEGNWGGAGTFFFQRKFGNTLDWAAKNFTKHKNFQGVKVSIANTIWSGFSKVAPELSAKVMAGAFGKVIGSFLLGELTLGASIAIQVGWEAIKGGLGFIKKFLTDFNFRNKVIDRIPLIVGGALSATGIFLSGIPAAIVAGLGIGGAAILAFLQAAALSLAPLFGLAATIALGVTAFFAIAWFGVISPSFKIDSGISNLIANIICDDSGNTTIPGTTSQNTTPTSSAPSGGVLARAVCLAKYLNQCYGPAVNASNVSKGLSCLATYAVAPSAIAEIEASASGFVNLQCVGFVKAAVVWGGKSIGNGNACDYVNDPKFVGGLGGVKQGDPIVFRSSGTCSGGAPGHIGIFKEDAGANICLVDANQKCAGCVVDGNCLPKTNVAGYLKL